MRVGIDFHWHSWEKVGNEFDPEKFKNDMSSISTRIVYLEAKCAMGWSYFPTKIGYVHPNLDFDIFGEKCRILKEAGKSVVAYFCLGMEGVALREHPEWEEEALVNSDWKEFDQTKKFEVLMEDKYGTPDFESPYLEEYAIPQIQEILKNYPVDGIWLDIFHPDNGKVNYGKYSAAKFEKAMDRPLLQPDEDPNYKETWEYFYKRGSEMRKEIRNAMKEVSPQCDFAINYACSSREPYLDRSELDYLSSDPCTPTIGNVFESGYFARFAAQTGKESEIHTCSHTIWGEWDQKEVPFMCREATVDIVNGSRYMLWDYQNPGGASDPVGLERFRAVERFIDERKTIFTQGENIGDIVVLSTVSTYKDQRPAIFANDEVYKKTDQFLPADAEKTSRGASHMLQYAAKSFVFADELSLEKQLRFAKLAVLPCQSDLTEKVSGLLRNFVENGGKLLAVGRLSKNVSSWCGLHSHKTLPMELSYFQVPEKHDESHPKVFNLGDFTELSCEADSERVLDYIQPNGYDAVVNQGKSYEVGIGAPSSTITPAAFKQRVGKGAVVLCGGNIFQGYHKRPSAQLIGIFEHLLSKLDFQARIQTAPRTAVEVVEKIDEDTRIFHFINLLESNNHPANSPYLPPIVDLPCSVECLEKPSKIVIQPANKVLDFTWDGNRADFTLDKLEIHSAVIIK